MAIIFGHPDQSCRGGATAQQGRTYVVTLDATSDADVVGVKAVGDALTAAGLTIGSAYRWPSIGTAVETDPALFLSAIDCDPEDEDGYMYRCTLTYGVLDVSNLGQDGMGGYDPFGVPPTFRAYSEDEEFNPLFDYNGVPIVNSCRDFLTDVKVPIPVLTFEVGVTVPTFDWSLIKSHKHHLNSSAWEGFAAGTVYCRDITPQRVWDDRAGFYKWEVGYVFQVKDPVLKSYASQSVATIPGWSAIVLDAGLREKKGGKIVRVLDDAGAPITDPIPLKADGTRVGPTEDFHVLAFDVLPRADFSTIPIPSGIFA